MFKRISNSHCVLGVVVDGPEPVAAGCVVGPAAGDALVAGWLLSHLSNKFSNLI